MSMTVPSCGQVIPPLLERLGSHSCIAGTSQSSHSTRWKFRPSNLYRCRGDRRLSPICGTPSHAGGTGMWSSLGVVYIGRLRNSALDDVEGRRGQAVVVEVCGGSGVNLEIRDGSCLSQVQVASWRCEATHEKVSKHPSIL
jgi:hypothetical protein